MLSLGTSRGDLKGAITELGALRTTGYLPAFAPLRAMLDNPIGQSPLKTNVAPGLLRFDPFVFEDLFALGLEFPIERRVFEQVVGSSGVFAFVRHAVSS